MDEDNVDRLLDIMLLTQDLREQMQSIKNRETIKKLDSRTSSIEWTGTSKFEPDEEHLTKMKTLATLAALGQNANQVGLKAAATMARQGTLAVAKAAQQAKEMNAQPTGAGQTLARMGTVAALVANATGAGKEKQNTMVTMKSLAPMGRQSLDTDIESQSSYRFEFSMDTNQTNEFHDKESSLRFEDSVVEEAATKRGIHFEDSVVEEAATKRGIHFEDSVVEEAATKRGIHFEDSVEDLDLMKPYSFTDDERDKPIASFMRSMSEGGNAVLALGSFGTILTNSRYNTQPTVESESDEPGDRDMMLLAALDPSVLGQILERVHVELKDMAQYLEVIRDDIEELQDEVVIKEETISKTIDMVGDREEDIREAESSIRLLTEESERRIGELTNQKQSLQNSLGQALGDNVSVEVEELRQQINDLVSDHDEEKSRFEFVRAQLLTDKAERAQIIEALESQLETLRKEKRDSELRASNFKKLASRKTLELNTIMSSSIQEAPRGRRASTTMAAGASPFLVQQQMTNGPKQEEVDDLRRVIVATERLYEVELNARKEAEKENEVLRGENVTLRLSISALETNAEMQTQTLEERYKMNRSLEQKILDLEAKLETMQVETSEMRHALTAEKSTTTRLTDENSKLVELNEEQKVTVQRVTEESDMRANEIGRLKLILEELENDDQKKLLLEKLDALECSYQDLTNQLEHMTAINQETVRLSEMMTEKNAKLEIEMKDCENKHSELIKTLDEKNSELQKLNMENCECEARCNGLILELNGLKENYQTDTSTLKKLLKERENAVLESNNLLSEEREKHHKTKEELVEVQHFLEICKDGIAALEATVEAEKRRAEKSAENVKQAEFDLNIANEVITDLKMQNATYDSNERILEAQLEATRHAEAKQLKMIQRLELEYEDFIEDMRWKTNDMTLNLRRIPGLEDMIAEVLDTVDRLKLQLADERERLLEYVRELAVGDALLEERLAAEIKCADNSIEAVRNILDHCRGSTLADKMIRNLFVLAGEIEDLERELVVNETSLLTLDTYRTDKELLRTARNLKEIILLQKEKLTELHIATERLSQVACRTMANSDEQERLVKVCREELQILRAAYEDLQIELEKEVRGRKAAELDAKEKEASICALWGTNEKLRLSLSEQNKENRSQFERIKELQSAVSDAERDLFNTKSELQRERAERNSEQRLFKERLESKFEEVVSLEKTVQKDKKVIARIEKEVEAMLHFKTEADELRERLNVIAIQYEIRLAGLILNCQRRCNSLIAEVDEVKHLLSLRVEDVKTLNDLVEMLRDLLHQGSAAFEKRVVGFQESEQRAGTGMLDTALYNLTSTMTMTPIPIPVLRNESNHVLQCKGLTACNECNDCCLFSCTCEPSIPPSPRIK